ncbi:MAG: selenocysteine-specific translation elongation factor [bacterium]|nr:selenocysteine-specific translation elongation factor [Deltaproteobacteria bacterium]MCP4905191.1 selenocysteine-specific translation elongation factor [bacterium]
MADDEPQSLVLGTAGHIDHGKTSLVRALTGHDLDRLPEEKARGITIELGFAPLELSKGLRVALIDVPGHERFVRTMVAGASGLDLVMLVVAADEGVMPQTREHLAICELLGVDRGLVVLTKSDLVDEEMIELATEEVHDLLAEGPLADAPIIAASAETGDGIEGVRKTLEALIRSAPTRDDDGRPSRLFIDRTFTKHGFGAVVTGTWSGRPRRVGDAIVLEPGARKAKIRGLERHGDAVAETTSGARIAVNLQGVGSDEIGRGDLLTEPDAVPATASFDTSLHWIARKTALEDAASVELLAGTAERRARVALIGEKPIGPGERGLGRIHVDGLPLPLLPGDRFVLRGFARDAGVGSTLGGGIVLDIAPPHRRRGDPELAAELTRMSRGDPAEGIELRIERAGLRGMTTKALGLETGLDSGELERALAILVETETILRVDASLCLAKSAAERLMADLVRALESFHSREPLQAGMPRAALTGTLPGNVSSDAGALLLKRLASSNEITIRGEIVTRVGFESTLDEEQSELAELLRDRFGGTGLDAPALRTVAEDSGRSERSLREIAHYLEREGTLVAAPDDLFFDRTNVLDLIDRVVAHFDSSDELDTQTLKALIGTSRRTAMPLMALLDDLQITRRDGSIRRLISPEPRW